MATLKEMRQGNRKWRGSCGEPINKLKWNRGDYDQATDKGLVKARDRDFTSLTVPGQSKSIKELMDRYEHGRPIPVE